MADKDFAKMQVGGATAKRRSGTVFFLLVLILLIAGGSFAGGFWMGMKFIEKGGAGESKGEVSRLQTKLKMLEAELRLYEDEAKERQKALEEASTSVGELTFYKELPEQEVTPEPLTPETGQQATKKPAAAVPETDVTRIIQQEMAKRPKSGVKKDGSFLIQVASYPNRSDAEYLRQELVRLRLTARLEEAVIPEMGVWYRVYLGPYSLRTEAEFDKKMVQEKLHITGLIIDQSRKP